MFKVLFVCIENSNRSQMAEAFLRLHGSGKAASYSAGSRPSGVVNPKAIASMDEKGYDLRSHSSKSFHDVERFAPFDLVVTMGCGDACPWMPAHKFVDWAIPDPKELTVEEFRIVRDRIEEMVKQLLYDNLSSQNEGKDSKYSL